MLSASKIGIKKVKGITQDQTPFVLPEQAAAPEVIEIDPSVTNTVVTCVVRCHLSASSVR
ncbi:hypothetical protein JCM19233_4173 [Vibrio astriarenae]|nr:hypothetical protein JCM19233_4173 [Vibrio sp. C7]